MRYRLLSLIDFLDVCGRRAAMNIKQKRFFNKKVTSSAHSARAQKK